MVDFGHMLPSGFFYKLFLKWKYYFVLRKFHLQWFASAEDEGRTEEPSDYKKRKAREEGRVAKSQEINSAIVLLFPAIVLIIMGPWILRQLLEMIVWCFSSINDQSLTGWSIFLHFLSCFFKCILPLALTAMVSGIAGNIVQNGGFLFTLKPIEPKFSKIAPDFIKYFKRTLFSLDGIVNLIKSILKITVIIFVSYLLIRSDIPKMLSLMQTSIWTALSFAGYSAGKLLIAAAILFLVLAIPDYIYQRYSFKQSLMMSKQEVKEEYKMMEGDPVVKGRLNSMMMEIMTQNISKIVPEADVVITNPTHYAVAVKFEKGMEGPQVTAKGVDEMALKIKSIARENGVSLVENRYLARALYTNTKINDTIPVEYYSAVAEILRHVYMLDASKRQKAL